MDSMLLLHLMSTLFPQQVRAIYIDHQLQTANASWGQFVAAQCLQLQIPCIVQTVQVERGNLENQARQARYQAFLQHLKPNEILVLAHHQQDQAETVLLNLFSGSGVSGLAAMQAIDIRDQLTLWRPLLDLSRQQIEQWSSQLQLDYVTDPTNYDIHYDRAWCREVLWPVLENRFAKMQQAITRSSRLMQDAEEILSEVLAQDWQHCGDEQQLKLEALAQLTPARQRQLLSAWIKGQGQYRPPLAMVERVQHEVIAAKTDAQAALHIAPFYYVRYQHVLYRLAEQQYWAQQQSLTTTAIAFQLQQSVQLAAGQFIPQTMTVGLAMSLLGQPLQVSARQGGEKIHLHGRVGRWPLKKAIQAAQIFPWQRHQIQILSKDDVMLGVFTPKGFWLAQSDYCEVGGWQPKWLDVSLH